MLAYFCYFAKFSFRPSHLTGYTPFCSHGPGECVSTQNVKWRKNCNVCLANKRQFKKRAAAEEAAAAASAAIASGAAPPTASTSNTGTATQGGVMNLMSPRKVQKRSEY